MRKLDLIIENIRDEFMINLLEEGEVSELETLKTKKFLNESLGRIRKMLVEEGALDAVKGHLANNWGKYLAGAGAGAGAGAVGYNLGNEVASDPILMAQKAGAALNIPGAPDGALDMAKAYGDAAVRQAPDALDATVDQAKGLAGQAGEAIQDAAGQAKEGLQQFGDKLVDAAGNIYDQAGEIIGNLKDIAGQAGEAIQDAVQ